jgi:Flp pilus assembly protein TadG
VLGGAKRRLDRLARGRTARSAPQGREDPCAGQALVEFAIVAPLIVMILLFAIWFYELIHIKLKVQEATRYAAWEATAFPLHDYAEGPDANDQLKEDALTQIRDDTCSRWC